MAELDETPPEQLAARGEEILAALRGEGQERLVTRFEPVQKELVRTISAQERASAEVRDAVLLRDAADERLDDAVAELSLAALELADGNAGEPIFRNLFPDGPQVVTTVPVDEEVRLVHDLLDKLAGHPLEERFRRKLELELEGAEQADRRLSLALSEESTTYASLRRATVTWILQARAAQVIERHPPGKLR